MKNFIKCFVFVMVMCLSAVGSAVESNRNFANVLSADGVSIAYSVYGKGETALVFIHGWSCDSRYWYRQIPYFSKKYRVVTIDLAGHGNSGADRKEYTMEKFAQDVSVVLDDADIKKAVLVGHSMGGGVIMQTAVMEPERVIGLIGVDTLEDIARPWEKTDIDQVFTPIKEDFKNNSKAFVRSMFVEGADSELVETIVNDISSADPEIAINVMEHYLNSREYELIKKVKVPLKSVNADLWPTNVDGNKKAAPEYELFLMKGVGHFLMLESPDEFNVNLEKAVEEIEGL